ncbi:PAS domain-containing protein [Tolypothrix sp. VBCCA 56010]|uniref:PAS domain-containing protein n=1 Tax=Tolypothrix sp. VBCCA 56010 TaxID=3137731 RepID=UPI003D7EC72D
MFDSKVNICCFCATTYQGITVHNDDEIIFNANHAFVTMTGYQVKDLIGKNSLEIIPESQEFIRKNILSNYEKPDEVVVVKKTVLLLPFNCKAKSFPGARNASVGSERY